MIEGITGIIGALLSVEISAGMVVGGPAGTEGRVVVCAALGSVKILSIVGSALPLSVGAEGEFGSPVSTGALVVVGAVLGSVKMLRIVGSRLPPSVQLVAAPFGADVVSVLDVVVATSVEVLAESPEEVVGRRLPTTEARGS